MATTADLRVDDLGFFEGLAAAMNEQPERFEILGYLDLVLGVVITRPAGTPFGARITFEGIECVGVDELAPGEESTTDCWLTGGLDAWNDMVADIRHHGSATGRQTLNSLTLVGETIRLMGSDVMGVDKFSRFNQSLQEFFDGAARLDAPRVAG